MKYLLYILLSLSSFGQNIKRFEFREGTVSLAAKLLSESSDLDIICTSEVGNIKMSPVTLKNRQPKELLMIMTSLAKVAYSYDQKLNLYTIKTLNEYRDELPYTEKQEIRIFKVEPLSLKNVAYGLQDLYSSRILYSEGLEVEDDSLESGSQSGSSSSSSSSSSSRNQGQRRSRNNASGAARFGVDFNSAMNHKLEQIIAQAKSDQRQNAIDKYIHSIRQDEPEIVVTLNQEHSQIIVRSSDTTALDQISKYIETNNFKIPQVLLEMKILELTIGDDFSSVFDYNIEDPFSSTATNLTNTAEDFLQLNPGNTFNANNTGFDRGYGTFAYELLSNKVAARIEILKQNNHVETLATPILIATNNRLGEIKIVTNEVFIDGFEYKEAETDDNGNITNPAVLTTEFSQEDVGLTLRIRPQVNHDDTVSLTIYQEDSSKISDGAKIPVAINGVVEDQLIDIKSEKTIQSTVIARDNKMIAIGGLVRTENVTSISKVPVLGDIPLLGFFFRDEATKNVKKELVLLITPHIMNNANESEEKSKKLIKKTSDHKFHEGGQKILDDKNSQLQQYKNPPVESIRDFVKDPIETLKDK